jgi:hypothetical protein
MRAVLLALSFSFVLVAGCGVVESPPAEETHVDDLTSAGSAAKVCPFFCTSPGVPCQLSNGTCTEACNACLCSAQGGKVVATCSAASPTDSPASDDDSLASR